MERITPPDNLTGTVSDELDRLEVIASKIGLITTEQAVDLLNRLDVAYRSVQNLDEGGQSRKVAETLLDGIISKLHKDAARFIRDLGGVQALERMRKEKNPPSEYSWWYLDQYVTEKRNASLRRALVLGGIVLTLLIVLVVVYQTFLAPDPQVVAVYAHQQTAQDYIMNGDLESALVEVNEGLAISPGDAELLISKAIILEKLDRAAEASGFFVAAEKSIPIREEFLATRGQAYLMSGQPEKALVDAQEAAKINPDYTQAYMISGQAYEFMRQYDKAMDDYDKAFAAAEKANKPELAAIARTRMAMLMQTMNAQPFPTGEATQTD